MLSQPTFVRRVVMHPPVATGLQQPCAPGHDASCTVMTIALGSRGPLGLTAAAIPSTKIDCANRLRSLETDIGLEHNPPGMLTQGCRHVDSSIARTANSCCHVFLLTYRCCQGRAICSAHASSCNLALSEARQAQPSQLSRRHALSTGLLELMTDRLQREQPLHTSWAADIHTAQVWHAFY